MLQHYIEINGLQLAYIEQNPTAQRTVFFVHGNSSSSRTWRKQFESDLLKSYRLIAIDLPGHGKSQAATDPANGYSLFELGNLLCSAVTTLVANQDYILVGISLGTNIIAEMLNFGNNPKGIMFGGPCIVGGKYVLESIVNPGADPSAMFSDVVTEDAVRKYATETSVSQIKDDIDLFLEDYSLVKEPFRSAFFKTLVDGKYSDEIGLLNKSGIPMAVVFGAEDKIIHPGYLDDAPLHLWNNRIYKVPGASHLVHIDQPLEFNQVLADCAFDIFK